MAHIGTIMVGCNNILREYLILIDEAFLCSEDSWCRSNEESKRSGQDD